MTSHDHQDGLVVVTGATGYLGAHVVQQMQQAGYRVRGTVRSLDQDKVDFLYHLCPDAKHSLELVKADLVDEDCWNDVIKGATYVAHVASPVPRITKRSSLSEEDLVTTARDGTLNVLRACVAAKTVQRVIVTSSSATLCEAERTGEVTEDDWADEKRARFYIKSKIVAERAAWNFVQSLSVLAHLTDAFVCPVASIVVNPTSIVATAMLQEDKLDIVTLQPGGILGPVLNKSPGTSIDILVTMMTGGMPMIPRIQWPLTDVRDVAECHVNALTADGAVGHRHIVMTKGVWMQDIAKILNEEFAPQGYNIPTRRCPYPLVWLMSWFNKLMAEVALRFGREVIYNITRMREVLGVNPRDCKDTVLDMGYSLIENGFVPKTAKYRGPSGSSHK